MSFGVIPTINLGVCAVKIINNYPNVVDFYAPDINYRFNDPVIAYTQHY